MRNSILDFKNPVTPLKLFLFVVALFVLTASNCNPPPPPPPNFEVNIDTISNPTPNLNDIYTITWSYSPAERLEDQWVELQSLTFDGQLSKRFLGCPPQEFRPPNLAEPTDCAPDIQQGDCPPNTTTFTNQCRFFVGLFTGQVIFSITGKDSLTGQFKRQSVTLRIANSHFRTGSIETSNQGYPAVPTAKSLDFMKYFAIYNDNRDNVSIEDLNVQPFSSIFDAEKPFWASSTSVEEDERFGFILGRNFPILDPGFIETAAGQRYFGQRTHAAAVVYAGTIELSGNAETKELKTDDGTAVVTVVTQLPVTVTFQGTTTSTFTQSVVFIQIDLADNLLNFTPAVEAMTPSNVKLGNQAQGLVMPTFGGEINPGVVPIIEAGQVTLIRAAVNGVGSTTGQIPSAGVAFQITQANGDLLLPASAVIQNIDWLNVPAFVDSNLELLLGQN